MKVSANYVPATDTYVAVFSHNGIDGSINAENGADLVEEVKKATGIDIEYHTSTRQFYIPEENRFDI